ncbi:hypothetical protein JCM3263A_02560 [Thermobifida fusca]
MPGITEQCQAARSEAPDDLERHDAEGQREDQQETPAVGARGGVMVVVTHTFPFVPVWWGRSGSDSSAITVYTVCTVYTVKSVIW